jgi:hypothetical protein
MLIKPRLFTDQLNGKQRVNLLPRRRHLGSDRIAEDLCHRLEQVMADHDVLLGRTPSDMCLYAIRLITWANDGAFGSISCTAYATTDPASALLCSPVAWFP